MQEANGATATLQKATALQLNAGALTGCREENPLLLENMIQELQLNAAGTMQERSQEIKNGIHQVLMDLMSIGALAATQQLTAMMMGNAIPMEQPAKMLKVTETMITATQEHGRTVLQTANATQEADITAQEETV